MGLLKNLVLFKPQPSGGGLALPVTPDLILDVEDLSLSDGASVTSWGDISTWELGDPTYNGSENAVQFASGQGGGQLRSLFGFNDIPAVTLTMLGRVTASVGNSLFISANDDDTFSRALATLSTRYEIEGGGRISDSDSYSLVSGPLINGLGGNVISTWVFDFANDAIRLYINGGLFATGGVRGDRWWEYRRDRCEDGPNLRGRPRRCGRSRICRVRETGAPLRRDRADEGAGRAGGGVHSFGVRSMMNNLKRFKYVPCERINKTSFFI